MQQLLSWKVPWLVEKDIARLRWLLDVSRQPVKVFDCGWVNFVHDVVVEDQPEAVWLHDWDIVAPGKDQFWANGVVEDKWSWYEKQKGRKKLEGEKWKCKIEKMKVARGHMK